MPVFFRIVLISAFNMLLAALPATAAPLTGRCYDIGGISFSNLTGVPGFDAGRIDSSMRVLLGQDYVNRRFQGSGGQRLDEGSRSLANPFARTAAPGDSCVRLWLTIDLEQSLFGNLKNAKSAIVGFAMFGVFSLLVPDEEGAVVQYRATVWCDSPCETLTVIGAGGALGSMTRLSRRDATYIADRRALWDLSFAIVERMDKAWHLKLASKLLAESQESYMKRMDSWSTGRP